MDDGPRIRAADRQQKNKENTTHRCDKNKNWSRGEGSPTVYFVPGREVVAVGLARRFGVGLSVGLSVPGWVARFLEPKSNDLLNKLIDFG